MIPKNARNFVDIVKEMVSEGESFNEVISNLQMLGLSRRDAEKLLGIVETKSSDKVEEAIQKMVKIKAETVYNA
ncbi:MAG: hypothetical protein CL943_03355 [Candidatus Diapherotrites archaeon]|uniref:Uncharacterized protein n=1 Tax=Candidatus Iainarchaeum sp. TaxID=3101447 RepID=A0A2D6M1K8_9ARCH|nr:hypothetical protein [Candidatus Diapherotrites archaeon]|tara:strand:+ start:1005 stop:1226 length:222 start_codon:yes stop_codon:yes gene_type:complete